MHERLVAIEHPAYPAPVRIAISGNSGIGKSTLINAILGLLMLCPTVSQCFHNADNSVPDPFTE
jgi:predicted GTPase